MADEREEPRRLIELGSQYIGDGVYARFDGYQVWVTTEGDAIALELGTMESLIAYARRAYGPNLGL